MCDLISRTKVLLEDIGAKGTVLISHEGYNAQVALPVSALENLSGHLRRVSELVYGGVSINIGQTIDYSLPSSPPFPFKKLVVRRKKAILTDGMDSVLDWESPGPELTAEQWHQAVLHSTSASQTATKAPVILGTVINVVAL